MNMIICLEDIGHGYGLDDLKIVAININICKLTFVIYKNGKNIIYYRSIGGYYIIFFFI